MQIAYLTAELFEFFETFYVLFDKQARNLWSVSVFREFRSGFSECVNRDSKRSICVILAPGLPRPSTTIDVSDVFECANDQRKRQQILSQNVLFYCALFAVEICLIVWLDH